MVGFITYLFNRKKSVVEQSRCDASNEENGSVEKVRLYYQIIHRISRIAFRHVDFVHMQDSSWFAPIRRVSRSWVTVEAISKNFVRRDNDFVYFIHHTYKEGIGRQIRLPRNLPNSCLNRVVPRSAWHRCAYVAHMLCVGLCRLPSGT